MMRGLFWLVVGLVLAAPAPEGRRPGGRFGPAAGGAGGGAQRLPGARPGGGGHAGGGAAAGGQAGNRMGVSPYAMMRGGLPQAEVISWRLELKHRPDSEPTHLGLAKALARYGKCDEAMDQFWLMSDSLLFDEKAAEPAAQCAARLGLYQDAVYFDQLGLRRSPDNVRLMSDLAIHYDLLGQPADVARTLDDLERLSQGGDPSLYARIAIAARHGDLDTIDQNRGIWTDAGWPPADLKRFDAQTWMDIDDPYATVHGVKPKETRSFGRHVYAEAWRRLGEPATAIEMMEADRVRIEQGVAADAVLSRAYADQGNYPKAAEILATYPPEAPADILASRWYLAKLQGQPEAARWSAAWKRENVNPLRSLAQLVPVTSR